MRNWGLSLGLAFLLQSSVFGQGVLIITNHPIRLPRPVPQPLPTTYHLESLELEARIQQQIADVQVSQTFVNSGRTTIEAQFVFPLPYDGAIDKMTLLVNGKELEAKLLSADEARQRYQSIVRANRDPALLEWIGTGMFQTSVFPIPPGEQRTVSIHYNQLLRKNDGLTDFLFPLRTARFTGKPLSKLSVRVVVDAADDLKNIYSPTHPIDIQRTGERHAVVTYKRNDSVPQEDFRLVFDTKSGDVGATVLTYRPQGMEDGYFLLLASPRVKGEPGKQPHKIVSFVVDKSGSMSGEKIEQAREAAKFVLNNLREGDLFNIISYDSQVQAFRPELEGFHAESRTAGLAYVDSLFAGGGTNIHGALLRSLQDLQDRKLPKYILFLTDGKPTSGITGEPQIAAAVRDANRQGARIVSFGVGYDVNSRLLDRLATENHGTSEYVRPDQDIEEVVARVFRKMSSPVFTDITLSVEFDGSARSAAVNRVYPGGTFDLYEGEQLVVVGRYQAHGAAKIRLAGTTEGQERTHEFTADFAKRSADDTNAFIARLWALRRIGEIIDELDLNGRNPELVEELVALSTKHGILTPYTSFLADETVTPGLASRENTDRARRSLESLSETSGQSAFEQRGAKQMFKSAPSAGAAPAIAASPTSGGLQADAAGRPVATETVRQTSTNAVYKRGKLLVTPETASLDVEKDKDQYTVVERYSDSYFKLVDENSKEENELLTRQADDEELLVQFRGKNYLIK